MEYQDVYVFAGLYGGPDEARMDYEQLSQLHKQDVIGKYQAALFEKQPDGKVKVLDTTSTTRSTGAKWGAAVGAAIGLVFPPAIVATTAEGAAIGALAGNLSKGWFKGDVKRLADQLQPGQAGIVAVAEAGTALDAAKLLTKAQQTQSEHVTGDDADKMKEQLESEQPVGTTR
jgi:uncharacterized membrane protein